MFQEAILYSWLVMGNVQDKKNIFHIWIMKNIHLKTQYALQGVDNFGFGGITCVTQNSVAKTSCHAPYHHYVRMVLCHNPSVKVPIPIFILTLFQKWGCDIQPLESL